MDILILGGFLGSGKTSIIRLLIQGIVNSGKTCAIIENEIGEIGIDDALIAEAGFEVTALFGGCVCCQISGDLITAVHRIEDEIGPDWIFVEMTGLALMDGIRDTFYKYSKREHAIHTVSVVDMSRWEHLTGALSYVFDRQVPGADVILLNKTDISAPTDETYNVLSQKSPGATIVRLDEQTKEPDVIWNVLMHSIGR